MKRGTLLGTGTKKLNKRLVYAKYGPIMSQAIKDLRICELFLLAFELEQAIVSFFVSWPS